MIVPNLFLVRYTALRTIVACLTQTQHSSHFQSWITLAKSAATVVPRLLLPGDAALLARIYSAMPVDCTKSYTTNPVPLKFPMMEVYECSEVFQRIAMIGIMTSWMEQRSALIAAQTIPLSGERLVRSNAAMPVLYFTKPMDFIARWVSHPNENRPSFIIINTFTQIILAVA